MELPYEEVPVKTGGDFKNVSPDVHPAICIAVIRLGTQETDYNGEKKWADKVLLRWEVHSEGEVTEKGEPLVIGKRYTFSLHEKSALYANVKSWRGVDAVGTGKFNIFTLLGKSCRLVVSETKKNDKTYANIDNILPYKGEPLTMFNTPVAFSLNPNSFKQETFDKLPEWLRDSIIASPEFAELHAQGLAIPHKNIVKPVQQSSYDDGVPADFDKR